MTRTSQRQTSPQDHGLLQPSESQSDLRAQSTSANRHADSASDNDTSERPVREKLKKTSIAAMPKYGIILARDDAEDDGDDVMASQNLEEGPTLGEESDQDAQESRGRPSRKRSFEDIKTTESHEMDNIEERSSGHTRKRSRDVKVGEPRKEGGGRTSSLGASVEEQKDEIDHEVLSEPAKGKAIEEDDTPPSNDEPADHVMRESAFSPRKKRSRDRFEEEIDREQKIAATEETRARKRSQEEEREQARPTAPTGEEKVKESSNGHPVSPKEPLGSTEKDKEDEVNLS